MQEIWKDIKYYEGLYQVSNLGRVKSLITNKIKTQYNCNSGYLRVGLFKNYKRENALVHRLVAKTFIKNELNKKQVNHIDGNKSNNVVTNLEWVTPSENLIHAYKIGLQKPSNIQKEAVRKTGIRNSIKIIQFSLDGLKIKQWDSISEVGRVLNIPNSNIVKCCKHERRMAGGFIWRYADDVSI